MLFQLHPEFKHLIIPQIIPQTSPMHIRRSQHNNGARNIRGNYIGPEMLPGFVAQNSGKQRKGSAHAPNHRF
jgi:hypothetical protein